MKIRTRGAQAFNVPNDPLGRMFLHLLKRYRNRGWYYRARGRGSRKEHGCQASIPKEYSEWMAVYMDRPEESPKLWTPSYGEPLTAMNLFEEVAEARTHVQTLTGGPVEYHHTSVITNEHSGNGLHDDQPGIHPPVRSQGAFCVCDPDTEVKCLMHHNIEQGTEVPGNGFRLPSGRPPAFTGNDPTPPPEYQPAPPLAPPMAPLLNGAAPVIPPPVVPVDAPENEVELTQKEQVLLESILSSMADEMTFAEPEELKEVFDSLYDKLVD